MDETTEAHLAATLAAYAAGEALTFTEPDEPDILISSTPEVRAFARMMLWILDRG